MTKRHLSYLSLLLTPLVVGCHVHKHTPESKEQTPLPPPPAPVVNNNTAHWHAPVGDSIRHEMRAVWLTTVFGLDWPRVKADTPTGIQRQQQELMSILDRLQADGFNTVFLQIRQSGSVTFPYHSEPFTKVFTTYGKAPEYDPIAFAIKECHKRNLAIHGWMVTYPLAGAKNHPITRMHPSWVIFHNGSASLDPGNPEVRTYIAQLSAEIARRYDLDGLHYDYFRYPEKAESFPDQRSYALYGIGQERASWRRSNLTAQLKAIRSAVASIKPQMQISVATLGKRCLLPDLGRKHGWTAFESVYQDPLTWAREGVVDFIVPMMYYRDDLYTPFLKDWKKSVGRYIPVVAGLAPYRMVEDKWNESVISQQIDEAQQIDMGGVCFFREEHIGAKQPTLRNLIRRSFSSTALPLMLSYGKQYKLPAPTHLKATGSPQETSISWQQPAQVIGGATYRIWATFRQPNGLKRAILLANGLKTTHYTCSMMPYLPFTQVEIGVESVNKWGVATPVQTPVVLPLIS